MRMGLVDVAVRVRAAGCARGAWASVYVVLVDVHMGWADRRMGLADGRARAGGRACGGCACAHGAGGHACA